MKSPVQAVQLQASLREATTAQQTQTLLQVVNTMLMSLGHFIHAPGEEPSEANRLAGEPRVAAETTFILACEALDNIIKDQSRWSTEFQTKVEKSYLEAHEKNLAFIEAQRRAAEEVASPHFRYRPGLHRLLGGKWCALLGDINNQDHAIMGIGDSPDAAMKNFDEVFCGKNLAVEEINQLIHEQENPMDRTGNEQPPSNESGGEDGGADSPGAQSQ